MELFTFKFGVMGCPACVMFYAKSQAEASQVMEHIHQELNRLNEKYSNYTPHSYIAEINRSAGKKEGVIVDEETATLLDYAQLCHQLSNGLFDVTAGILYKAWDFDTLNPTLPSRRVLDQLLERVGWGRLKWERPHLILPIPGMTIDFGGVVKEYAVDRVAALCYAQGIHHGIIELGGDLYIIGPRPNESAWTIGVQNPFNPTEFLFTFTLAKGGVATSGDYARYIEIDGIRYCHIMNPLTGMPIQSVGSVTVIASPCLVAGSMSTIAFLMEKKGIDWLKDQRVPFAFVGNDRSLAFSGLQLIISPEECIDIAA